MPCVTLSFRRVLDLDCETENSAEIGHGVSSLEGVDDVSRSAVAGDQCGVMAAS